jgi:uncharacterized protein YbaP (TraB family)
MQRMKALLRCFVACLIAFHCIAIAEDKAPALPSKPLLWRIEGAKPSYVFGTIHLTNPAVAKIDSAVEDAITASDVVLTEVPFDPETMTAAAKDMFLPDGAKLADLLPADLLREIEAEYERILPSIGPKILERVKIIYATVMLGMLEDQVKNPGRKPLDMILASRAGALGKKTGGLETVAEQLAVLNAFTTDEQITMLRDSLRLIKEKRKAGTDPTTEITTAYQSGDLAAVDEWVNSYMRSSDKAVSEKFMRILLTERNRRMVDRAVAKMKAEPDKAFFFAVGAGHLLGETGILRLLEKDGFKVVRIEPIAK